MINPLQRLFARATRANHPVYASMELTYACNLACRFCYNPVQRKGQPRTAPVPPPADPPLTLEETLLILDELKAMNVLYLTLTGGEPLLHPHFWEIAEAGKERGFALRIFSNGVAIDEAAADRFAELSPYCLEISIHGAKEETTVALNGVPGSFQRLLRALELLSERGVSVFLKCVVTKLVEDEIEELYTLAQGFGFPIYFDPLLYPSMDGEDYPLELAASDKAVLGLFASKTLKIGNSPFERRPEFNCSVASGTLHIDPFGNLHPCTQWKESVGNVRGGGLRELWTSSPRLAEIRVLNASLPEHTERTVSDHAFCLHCPALSLRRNGDPARVGEQALRIARLKRIAHLAEEDTQT